MDQATRSTALHALGFLLLDSKVNAVRFRGTGFTLLFDPIRVDAGEIYLYLDSAWVILPDPPKSELTIPFTSQEQSPIEQLGHLYSLHDQRITRVWIGAERPHLFIQFEDTRVFAMNGHDEQYESWEIGTTLLNRENPANFTIIALPNNRLAVWTPKEFP